MRGFVWALGLLGGLALAQPQTYAVEGRVTYAASYTLGRWEGTNTSLQGVVRWDSQTGEATGRVCVDLARFDSGNPLRDADARGVFNVSRYPQSCLEVEQLVPFGEEAVLAGALEISGVRRSVRVRGRLVREGNGYLFSGGFSTSFTEWRLIPPSLLFLRVNDPVEVWVEARATPR
ncbi:YceI-like domain protein [Meiothermus luteus]|jgi:polyisoprenoid-binding protein YceI|uniref:YceI-like domain protein n=1 Tax=Meiothermus luteus TaxID=2026184 RepID=A0A399EY13_9DEIN|nr:YceI family protein [Meiothermus luteus]RIH87422.1 YceI-like domain protein [Meiothermus luteus]RMH58044.1 MAG: YceI family protein [Deinococcota bacterium]